MTEFASRPGVRAALAIVLLLALLFGAQALANASAPPGGVASTGRLIGQTSFAYLGGLRTFAAAVLWNRLEPIFDSYYGNFDRNFGIFLPTMRLVQALDPHFEQSFYVTSYWLLRSGRTSEAISLAEDGLRNNPQSGLLRANLVEILLIRGDPRDMPRIMQLAADGIGPKVQWANTNDQYEGYGIFAAAYDRAGDKAAVAEIRKAQDKLKTLGATATGSVDASGLPVPKMR